MIIQLATRLAPFSTLLAQFRHANHTAAKAHPRRMKQRRPFECPLSPPPLTRGTSVRSTLRTVRLVAGLSLIGMVAGAQAPSSNPREAMLVTPAWVASHLGDANVVVIHVGDPAKYTARHIGGPRLMELSDISVSDHSGMSMPAGMAMPPEPITGPKNGLILEMPTAEQLRSQLASFGISDNSRIIVYS